MIDHVYISVTNPVESLAFYTAALEPLGWTAFGDYDGSSGPESVPDLWGMTDAAGIGEGERSASIWLRQRNEGETGLYLGVAVDSPEAVDAAYAAALAAGGRDDGPPAMRLHFADGYYAGNILDLDDNRLEFVHKGWNRPRA